MRADLIFLLLAALASGCGFDPGAALDAREQDAANAGRLLARFVHLTDTHVMDTLSPARFPGTHELIPSAWRPYEAWSLRLLDGTIRAVNAVHASGRTIDFVLHTGDACDNAQGNERDAMLRIMDGGRVTPLSGPDDRPAEGRPPPEEDPYAPFDAVGLYRTGVHGPAPSIPWYFVLGNHDVRALGVFPILTRADGVRYAPLPLPGRPGFVLPRLLEPTADYAYGFVTPALPGPPALLNVPQAIAANPERAYFTPGEFIAALFATASGPAGHGFAGAAPGARWYSVAPAPGVRLLGLNTTDARNVLPGGVYSEGALSRGQFTWLREQLALAEAAGEWVIVATHHPSDSLTALSGSEVFATEFRAALGACAGVVLHVAGHTHENRVTDWGTYVEIETCSTLDAPREARLIELRQAEEGGVSLAYEMVSGGGEIR